MNSQKISVPVWLFCEWMRILDLRQEQTVIHQKLWRLWENAWLDVEARLIDLAKRDVNLYAELLTDEVFAIENLSSAEWRILLEISTFLHARLRQEAKFYEDTVDQASKAYEVDESAIIMGRLRRIVSDYERDYLPFE